MKPHTAAKGCVFQILPGLMCRKSEVAAENPLAFPASRQVGMCYVCAEVLQRDLKDPPTGPSMAFQNPCCTQKSDCVLSQRQIKKKNTLEMSPHFHFHTAICVDLVKKFNGTKYLFAEQNFQGEHPPSKNFRMSPFTLLSY
jgi:hypothetical protein